jgi:hypothetical protein
VDHESAAEASANCLKVYWVLRSPGGGLLHCGLFPAGKVYEVRASYGLQPALRTQLVATEEAGAAAAASFKMIALSLGYLERSEQTND